MSSGPGLPSYDDAVGRRRSIQQSARVARGAVELRSTRRSYEDNIRNEQPLARSPALSRQRSRSLPSPPAPQDLAAFRNDRARLPLASLDRSPSNIARGDYAILVMGATGAGKSSFIAAATGLSVGIGHTLDSYTREPQGYVMDCRSGTRVALIDTPGFNGLYNTDLDVLESIITYTVGRELRVIAIIFLHRITDKKITGSSMVNLRVVRALCGEHFYQSSALVTSMWAAVPRGSEEVTAAREVELNTTAGYWDDMFRKGADYARWDERVSDHAYSAKQIVDMRVARSLDHDPPIPTLQIRLELERGVAIEETSAGKLLTEALRKRREKEQLALEEEQEEREALEQERRELEARLNRARDGVRREAEISSRRHTRNDMRASRDQNGPPSVLLGSERRSSGLPGSSGESQGYFRRSSRRDGRSATADDYDIDDRQHRPRPTYRRDSDRGSGVSGWLRYLSG